MMSEDSDQCEMDQEDREPEEGEADGDVMNMFASVWVKVEVGDGDEETPPCIEKGRKPQKKKWKANKILRCDACEYTTIYKNCLELHIAGHNGAKPYACSLCDYSTKYPTALNRHMIVKHQASEPETTDSNAPLYKCQQCDYKSHYKWNLSAHKRKHKPEKQFKCPNCTYETAYRHNFMKHSKVHNEGVFFRCDKCPFVTKFEGHITRHLAKIHNEVIDKANKCDFCDFCTKVNWRLNIHKQRSKQENVMKCTYCEFETYYMCEIKKHKVTHYSEIYGIKNTNQIDMNCLIHKTVELPEPVEDSPKKDQVNYDEYKTDSKKQYLIDPNCLDWNNIDVLESNDKDKPFQCHMCPYSSKFKAAVQRHFQRHHTGSLHRPYKCCNCDFSTKTKDQISLHNKRSKSDKELSCNVCDFTSMFKCAFVLHQKSHYAFKCTACTYSCKHKYEMQKHYSTLHLGNGLKCTFCDYKASRKESLLCHQTIHTGVKPFKCSLCDYMSVRKSLLDIHVKKYHSDVKKDITIVTESKIESLKVSLPPLDSLVTGFSENRDVQL